MSSDILEALGFDLEELEWKDLSLCKTMAPDTAEEDLFYDKYESSSEVAKVVDALCLTCPVMKICLAEGLENNEWGVWGGHYLVSGKVDKNRNAHKTEEVKEAFRKKISG